MAEYKPILSALSLLGRTPIETQNTQNMGLLSSIGQPPAPSMGLLSQLGQPQPEMRSYDRSPTERVAGAMQDGLMALGANNYNAGKMAHSLSDLANLTPLGGLMGLADAKHAYSAGNYGDAALSMAAAIPGARPVARSAPVKQSFATTKEAADAAIDAITKQTGLTVTPLHWGTQVGNSSYLKLGPYENAIGQKMTFRDDIRVSDHGVGPRRYGEHFSHIDKDNFQIDETVQAIKGLMAKHEDKGRELKTLADQIKATPGLVAAIAQSPRDTGWLLKQLKQSGLDYTRVAGDNESSRNALLKYLTSSQ